MTKNINMTVVDADGEIITAAFELVSSDNPELVRLVKAAAEIRADVQFIAPYGQTVEAELNRENPLGIAAALFAARPGRTKLLEAPAEVWDWLKNDSDENGEPDSYPVEMSEEEALQTMEQSNSLEEAMRLLSLVEDDTKEIEK